MPDHLSAAQERFIDSIYVARLATVDPHGGPHVIPVCFAFDRDTIYTPLDEKPKKVAGTQLKRVRNIEQDDRVSLLIDHYEDDWARLAWVQIHGRARLVQPGEPEHARGVDLLRKRYVQYRSMRLEQSPVIGIAVVSVSSWSAG